MDSFTNLFLVPFLGLVRAISLHSGSEEKMWEMIKLPFEMKDVLYLVMIVSVIHYHILVIRDYDDTMKKQQAIVETLSNDVVKLKADMIRVKDDVYGFKDNFNTYFHFDYDLNDKY